MNNFFFSFIVHFQMIGWAVLIFSGLLYFWIIFSREMNYVQPLFLIPLFFGGFLVLSDFDTYSWKNTIESTTSFPAPKKEKIENFNLPIDPSDSIDQWEKRKKEIFDYD